jgi:hypothetical protein
MDGSAWPLAKATMPTARPYRPHLPSPDVASWPSTGQAMGVTRDDIDDPARDADEPEENWPPADGAWGRTANPNTVDGELQNIAAFSSGFSRLAGNRRTAAKVVVWLILLGFAVVIIYGIVGIVRIW